MVRRGSLRERARSMNDRELLSSDVSAVLLFDYRREQGVHSLLDRRSSIVLHRRLACFD